MSDIMKAALQGTVPRWVTAILMAVCSAMLVRMVQQNDAIASVSSTNTRDIAVIKSVLERNAEGLDKAIDTIGKIDQIARLLEQRLIRLETREEKR